MLRKTITFTDFNGNNQTEDHYFHLSKADLIEMEVEHPGGMQAHLQAIVDSNDGKQIIAELKNLILASYGQKSEDGKRFIKSPELRSDFQNSEAYSSLFLELCTNAEAASAFINGIVPPGLEADMARATRAPRHPSDTAATMVDPSVGRETKEDPHLSGGRNVFETHPVQEETTVDASPRVLTEAEAREMDSDELRSGLATGRYTLR